LTDWSSAKDLDPTLCGIAHAGSMHIRLNLDEFWTKFKNILEHDSGDLSKMLDEKIQKNEKIYTLVFQYYCN
jgi:hypothetical protein